MYHVLSIFKSCLNYFPKNFSRFPSYERLILNSTNTRRNNVGQRHRPSEDPAIIRRRDKETVIDGPCGNRATGAKTPRAIYAAMISRA